MLLLPSQPMLLPSGRLLRYGEMHTEKAIIRCQSLLRQAVLALLASLVGGAFPCSSKLPVHDAAPMHGSQKDRTSRMEEETWGVL